MRVVMLVSNPCVNDARVIREAEAVAAAGHDVLVLAHAGPGLPAEEQRNGFHLKRVNVLLKNLSPADDARGPKAPVARWNELPVHEAAVRFAKSRAYSLAVRLRGVANRAVRRTVTPTGFLSWRHVTGFGGPARAWKPDVVHAHDLFTLAAGHRIASSTGARLIYDSHELELGRNGRFTKSEMWLKKKLEGGLITKSDAVITVCDSIADHLKDYYRIARPIVVHNAPAMDLATRAGDDVKSALGLGPEVPLAIYVGSVTFNRGVEIGVDAIAHLPGVHYAMIGPRNPVTEEATRKRAKELAVEDRVHFIDPVPHDEVVDFIRTADVSLVLIQDVCLSYRYCFPNKLLESLLAGVPVVASRLVELERMVELTKCGVVVDEKDARSIADGVSRILADRVRFTPTDKTRNLLRETYSWERQSEKLAALYERLASKS